MRNKKKNQISVLLLILLGISIGFAALATTLKINGSTTITKNTWNIYWDNIDNQDGVTPTTSEIVDEDATHKNNIVNFAVTFDKPGDYYEFTVDAVNAGTLDAEILSIEKKYNDTLIPETGTSPVPSYLKYEVTYADGSAIAIGNKLAKAQDLTSNPPVYTTKTYKIRVEYDKDAVTKADINNQVGNVTHTFSFKIDYGQATETESGQYAECPGEGCLYAFYSPRLYKEDDLYGKDVTSYDYDGIEEIEVLPLTFATAASSVTSNYNGGVVSDYRDLRVEHDYYKSKRFMYGVDGSIDWYFNSEEMCNYWDNNEVPCTLQGTVSYTPPIFAGFKIDNNRNVLKSFTCGVYEDKTFCIEQKKYSEYQEMSVEEKEDYANGVFSDLVKVYGQYDDVEETGCNRENFDITCVSSDKKQTISIYEESVDFNFVHPINDQLEVEIFDRFSAHVEPVIRDR